MTLCTTCGTVEARPGRRWCPTCCEKWWASHREATAYAVQEGRRGVMPWPDQLALVSEVTRFGWMLTERQMKELQGSYVYVLWRGPQPLYVGVKTSASERPFDPVHHVLGVGVDSQENDELTIYPMPTPTVARWAEKILIEHYRPLWNQQLRHAETWDRLPITSDPGEEVEQLLKECEQPRPEPEIVLPLMM